MKHNSLIRANEIQIELDKLNSDLKLWNGVTEITLVKGYFVNEGGYIHYPELNHSFLDFELLKTLSVSRIEKRIKVLKEEFEAL